MFTFRLCLLTFVLSTALLFSQEQGGGESPITHEQKACFTEHERSNLLNKVKSNLKLLQKSNKVITQNKTTTHPLFIWPVKKTASVKYTELWTISNYVDHNQAYPNALTDYNGGTRTYDTTSGYNHKGIDIFAWPYSWNRMDKNQFQVIAAAEGTIIYKNDGQFDQSCDFSNTENWNAVFLQHTDGSVSWYGHLKKNSTTAKNVGDWVDEGEFLGVVGSSGVSTGPHLHFEVYEDATFTEDKLIDPYVGTFNNWNTDSWWKSQKPYRNPTINALTTNSAVPDFGDCPALETTYENDTFILGETVYAFVFLKDQLGTDMNLKIFNPIGDEMYNWSRDLTQDYNASYWYFSYIPNSIGTWSAKATLSTGQEVTHNFSVDNSLSTTTLESSKTILYPNPVTDKLFVSTPLSIKETRIYNAFGKLILQHSYELNATTSKTTIDTASLAKGWYLLVLTDENGQTFSNVFSK